MRRAIDVLQCGMAARRQGAHRVTRHAIAERERGRRAAAAVAVATNAAAVAPIAVGGRRGGAVV